MSTVATLEPSRSASEPNRVSSPHPQQETKSRFSLRRIAISPIIPGSDIEEPTISEVDLETFSLRQKEIIERYLDEHLERAWRLPESGRTVSGNFAAESVVKGSWERILNKPPLFMEESRTIARRLFEVTPTWASPGVLLFLFFEIGETSHLGLFKLDPGSHDRISLKEAPTGEMLLELAARHVKFELPEPGDRVLKWAIIPHPTNPEREIKLRDEQGDETAIYFVRFLQCQDYHSELRQAADFIAAALTHGKDTRRLRASRATTLQLLDRASRAPDKVELHDLIGWLKELHLVRPEEIAAFESKLAGTRAKRLRVAQEVFERLTIRYKLRPSGLTISGNVVDVLSLVNVVRQRGYYSFALEASDYDIRVGA